MWRLALIVMGSVAGLALVIAWHMGQTDKPTRVRLGYAAKQVCSCIYLERRPLEACRADLDSRAQKFRVRVLEDEEAVEARATWQVKRLARHVEGMGCTLQ